jgi:hypothetical protein
MEFTGYRDFVVPGFYVVNTTTFSFPFIFILGWQRNGKELKGTGGDEWNSIERIRESSIVRCKRDISIRFLT